MSVIFFVLYLLIHQINLKSIILFKVSFAMTHIGNLLICSDSAVQLLVDENWHNSLEGSDAHEGLHTRRGHSGDRQHPQPIWEEHRQHGSQSDTG